MKLKILILLLTGMLASLTVLFSGCDGGLGIQGSVNEWVNAPNWEKGEIYIDVGSSHNLKLKPIGSAHVAIYYKNIPPMGASCVSPDEQDEIGKWLLWDEILSDPQGEFEKFWVIAAGEYPLKIVVEKEGYYSVEKEFMHGGGSFSHVFDIWLVRKP